MAHYVIIREYKQVDFALLQELVRNVYLSNVTFCWYNALTKEITFQLIVMSAAVMFIFIGIPLQYCISAIPVVVVIIYISIYGSLLFKATELMHSKKVLKCWIAEAYEPFFFNQTPDAISYRIVSEMQLLDDGIEVERYKKKIIGSVAITTNSHSENSAWMFRLAIDKRYRNKGIGHALVQSAQIWCKRKNFESIEVAMSECQDTARQLFVDTGFEVKQMYHKQLVGSALTLLMYQLECNLNHKKPNL